MKYVYLLRSQTSATETYIGATCDLQRRLAEHNARKCRHTSKYAPWTCVLALRFLDHSRADAFERYRKSGSGRAFAKRHLW